jgi:serine/threonine-protein kinase
VLQPGARVGPFEIDALLGQGGMGEVYRARDTRLKRDVALKVLPDLFAADPDRLARFEREARTLASLNHPSIATAYGVEEAGGVRAIVMELVEGPTLADRITEGPIPVDEGLSIARRIAEALDAAHEQGVIHRDLKPANIKLRPDGAVKVLDFGLAKTLAASPVADLSASPTVSLGATQAGVILGTAAYMAPEQAKGKPADRRSDVWAFGCVLYEMLTGTRAFGGDDITEVISAVVRLEPDWKALPADVPVAVRTLLRACLAKDRGKRPDVTTALFLLNNTAALVERDSPASGGSTAAARRARTEAAEIRSELARRHRRRLSLIGAAAAVLGATGSGGLVWWAMRSAPPPPIRTEITTAGATALSIGGNDRDIAITPDGSRIIYRSNEQLLVRALDQLQPTVLSGLGAVRHPFVSPDGQWIGFFDGVPLLKKVAISGGPPVTLGLASDGTGPRGGTWGPDGTIIFATNAPATGLQQVGADGGDPHVLTKPDQAQGERDHLWPEFLPDGRAVLFTITAARGGLDNAQVAVLDLATGTYKVVVRGGHHAHYVPTGHLVYGAGGTLRAVAFDRDRLEAVGTPVPILDGVATTAAGGTNMAIAADGTMVYVPGRGVAGAQRSLVWVDRSGREDPVPAPARDYSYPRGSPDGTRIALYVGDQEQDIWVWDLTRQTLTRLTFDPAQDSYPVWTPDGRRVIYTSVREAAAAHNLWWQLADGTGTAERLSQGSREQRPTAVSPDGVHLVFHELGTMRRDLMVLRLGSAAANAPGQPALPEVSPLLQTPFEERNGIVSPNGRWLAYESDASGRLEIYVRPFPNVSDGQWQLSTTGGARPLWSRNGQELFYVAADGALMSVRVETTGATWRAGQPARALEGRYFTGATAGFAGRTYDVSPDGRRFLMLKDAGGDEASHNLVVVQHWFEELERLVSAP